MAKKSGTKHHVIIKLSDLNKMFKDNDVIPVPKGFVKSIAYLLSAHSVSLGEVEKDTADAVDFGDTTQATEVIDEQKVQVTELTSE